MANTHTHKWQWNALSGDAAAAAFPAAAFFFGCRRRDETVLTSSLRHHVDTRHARTQPLTHAFSLSLCAVGLCSPLSRKLSLHIFIHKALPQLRCRVYQLRLAACARARALSRSLTLSLLLFLFLRRRRRLE